MLTERSPNPISRSVAESTPARPAISRNGDPSIPEFALTSGGDQKAGWRPKARSENKRPGPPDEQSQTAGITGERLFGSDLGGDAFERSGLLVGDGAFWYFMTSWDEYWSTISFAILSNY